MSGALIPNANMASAPHDKVRRYLLDPDHPGNGGKAAFFGAFGFTAENWIVLKDALQRHAQVHAVTRVSISPWGTKYEVRCSLPSPDGRNPCVRTFWIIDAASPNPRLVTAYANS